MGGIAIVAFVYTVIKARILMQMEKAEQANPASIPEK
jgi:hypothetical protein